jgi:diguanylate cyclase (GGDEF)-like protein
MWRIVVWGFSSLRARLIGLVTIILIGGFLATNILSYQNSRDTLLAEVLNYQLPLSSNNIYSEIQADLLQPIVISSLMAHDTFVQDWALEGEKDPKKMIRYLNEIQKKYGVFTNYFISNQTLNYYHPSGISRKIEPTVLEDSWFARVREMSEPYEVNVDYNVEEGGAITIFINYRVLDARGNFLGVTGVGLGLESVARLVKDYQRDFHRRIYFVDNGGNVTVRSDEESVGERIQDMPGLQDIAPELLGMDHGSLTYERNGEPVLLTVRYIPELNWRVLVELDESDITKTIEEVFLRNLVIGLFVIVLTILLIAYTISIFQRQLEKMAVTDKLTGLGNRQAFDISMIQAISRFKRTKEPFSLILMDVDRFKPINDTKGHLAGDVAICQIALKVRALLRDSDVMCRWGGDEFAIIMANCSVEDARRLAEKIRLDIVEHCFFPDDPSLRISISFGVSEIRKDDEEAAILARSDGALYSAKDKGRNRTETA